MTSESLSEQHKRLGRAVTSLISEHAARLESAPVTSTATPADLKRLFDEPIPSAGVPAEEIYLWASIAGMPDDIVQRHIELLAAIRPQLALVGQL